MPFVRDPVDDGNAAVLRKFAYLSARKSAQHDRGDTVTRQHDGGVFDAFPARELRLVFGKEDKISAKLSDADLEGNARTCGNVVKQKSNGLAFEHGAVFAHAEPLFHGTRGIEKFKYFLGGKFGQTEQIFRPYFELRDVFIDIHVSPPVNCVMRAGSLPYRYILYYNKNRIKKQPVAQKK